MTEFERRIQARMSDQERREEGAARNLERLNEEAEAKLRQEAELEMKARQLGKPIVDLLLRGGVPTMPVFERVKVGTKRHEGFSLSGRYVGTTDVTRHRHLADGWHLINRTAVALEGSSTSRFGVTTEGRLFDSFRSHIPSDSVQSQGLKSDMAGNVIVDPNYLKPAWARFEYEDPERSVHLEEGVASLLRGKGPADISYRV